MSSAEEVPVRDLKGHGDDASQSPAERVARRDAREFRLPIGVLLIGLVVTAALTWISSGLYTRNENRLLRLRAREVGSVLTAALPGIQTPLASAAVLADATGGDAAKFKQLISPYVGLGRGQTFISASLWRVSATAGGPVAVVGSPPKFGSNAATTAAFFLHASKSSKLSVIGLLGTPPPRLGYAYTGMAPGPFAVYAESPLPSSRYEPVQTNSAFNDINFAFYLGRSTRHADLLVASVHQLPLGGRQVTTTVPFGDTEFTLVVSPRRPLGGSLPQTLPWAIAIVGMLLALGAAALTLRLVGRRRYAERLAGQLELVAEENRRLYAHQRGIAETLQHALLPETLPQIPGVQVGARYEAGVEGVEIGGDWYDVIVLDDRQLLLVVGDVSGKGLRAAATMASLRFAIHAYAAEGDAPEAFLPKLSRLIDVHTDRQIATVLCAVVDVPGRKVTITSAGHLPPLLVSDGGGELVEAAVGLPVGVERLTTYSSATISAPRGATLIAFTDGLVERRGESIDVGLERLKERVSADNGSLEELLTGVVDDLRHDSPDDTAVAGIRWVN